ncbi:hypothetical protein EIP86_011210 [Pleurotus ostreatoroseus]|nr:hypothetical protein EIP86_011210 [Pleurotus ostreatoroseus]
MRNKRLRTFGSGLRAFFIDVLPRQIYLHFLFRLPALYFSRVARIFEDAEVSKHEIQRMIEACMLPNETNEDIGTASAAAGAGLAGAAAGLAHSQGVRYGGSAFPFPVDWNPPSVSPALARFKHSWEQFVDSLLREWKTLNLVSVLLCTALLTMFQIPDAAGDPITRWAALFSLIFAIMSLTYGCIYIVQFGAMRSMYKASRWAEEAQKTKTLIWWNIWVLLAMPAIWLAWAMAAFCVAILSYIWRTGSADDPDDGRHAPLSHGQALAVRTTLTVIFGLGLIYFILVLRTFGTYGEGEVSWRRSWLATGHPAGRGARVRERREEVERERGRRRQRAQDRDQDRQSEHELKQSSPSMGLGLLGVSGSGAGMASMTSVMQDDAPWDKTEKKAMEDVYVMEAGASRGRGRISPKL